MIHTHDFLSHRSVSGMKLFLSIFSIILLSMGTGKGQQPFDIETIMTAENGSTGDQFGSSIASDDQFVFIGAAGTQAVYVFGFNGSYWEQTQRLEGTAGGAFGTTIDLDGNYAIIGDKFDDDVCGGSAGCNSGAAYIYKYNGIDWQVVKKLSPSDAAQQNFFGYDVAIHGNIAIVSAQNDYNNNAANQDYRFQGSVYIFQRDAGGSDNWGEVAKFKSADLGDGRQDEFGRAIDLTENYAFVGSNNNDSGIDQNGSVYIYYRNQNGPDQWGRQSIIKEEQTGPNGGNFGLEISVDNDILVIGDNYDQENDKGDSVHGSLSVYRLSDGEWPFESMIFPTDPVTYGQYFQVSGSYIAVNPQTGISTYMYRYQDGSWVKKPDVTNSDNFNLSGALGLSGVTLVAGAEDYDAQKGAAYFFEFIATPTEIKATDGKFQNRSVISWKNRSNQADGFRIYRDNEEAGSALSVATTYSDYDGIPGKIHTYRVSAYNNTWNESQLSASDLGWKQARGEIRGNVKTDQGAAIKDVELTITDKSETVGTYLHFDGVNDYVALPYLPRNRQMTLSAWIRSSSNTDQQIIGWGSAEAPTIEFKIFASGNLAYAEWTGSDWSPVISERIVNDGEWHFVCAAIDEDSCKLYIDGMLDKTGTGFSRDITVTTTSIGAYDRVSAVQQFFQGDIDDVRMWNVVRSADEVKFDMENSLDGDEEGLAGYWTFDDSTRSGAGIAADYKHDGGHHGIIMGTQWKGDDRHPLKTTYTNTDGAYRIKNFYFEDEKEFKITPYKEKHLFDPEYREMSLEGGIGGTADFTDTTSFTVSGRIVYAGTSCGAEGVELLLNDESTNVFTDESGQYSLAIEEPGKEYTIKPVLGESDQAHTFQPGELTLTVEDDTSGLDFSDKTKHLLYGKVRGGCIAGLGTALIRVTDAKETSCFDTTIVTDFNGNFRVFLPAQEYRVDLTAIDYPDSADILSYFDMEETDLRFENQRVNFIYHPKPIVQLTFFPYQSTCGDNPVPIMAQFDRYDVLIEVLETYGTDTCLVTTGSVNIYDDIGGNPDEPVTLSLRNGRANYRIVPGVPNILGGGNHPYQKLLEIKADVEGRIGVLDQWILVTGHRPRTPTFASTTPQLPFMVFRDPPGDHSYSFQTKGTTITTRNSIAYESSKVGGPYFDIRLGSVWSFGAGATTDFGGYAILFNQDKRTGRTGDLGSLEGGVDTSSVFSISMTTNEEFRTSDEEGFTGEDADVFIGAALNQVFALTDIIDYDPATCSVVRDTSLAMDVTGFESTYIYTAGHIRDTVIPQLQQLVFLNPDSADYFNAAIDVWQQALDLNAQNKKAAVKDRNISFSGGTSTTYTGTTLKDSTYTIGYSQIFERERYFGLGAVISSVPLEIGYKSRFEWKLHRTSLDSTNSQATTIGYTLSDDDEGDFFSVDIKTDKQGFGTPVFDLVAGTSSCPWEAGTQPRDGAALGIDKFVAADIAPNEPATFTLTLGNTSESGEARPNDLRMIHLSNPDGAIIKVGGVPMGDGLSYYIPAGDSAYKATLTVERGPLAYDYENLQLMMVPPCEYDAYNSATALSDTVTFSVHFSSPLSNVNLTYPADDWVVNSGDLDSLPVVIGSYNKENAYLKNIKLQYRIPDGNWITAFEVPRETLPEQTLERYWQLQSLADGNYELRVASDGGANGVRYSSIARGRVERNALLESTNPEPADGILNVGEEISLSLTGMIDNNRLNIKRDIQLMDASDSTLLGVNAVINGKRLVIRPEIPFSELDEKTLIASVSNIISTDGKRLYKPINWRFSVNQYPVYWKSLLPEIKVYEGEKTVYSPVLYNAGAASAGYRIAHLPAWLSIPDEERQGTIASGQEKQMTFTITGEITRGSVSDSLTIMMADQKESRPLMLTVLSAPPAWYKQKPVTGAYMMQVYAQLLLNGQISEDAFDFAGVFIGDQLCGIGRIRRDEETGKYLAAFPIYYPAQSGNTLTFRLWDASQGREYSYYSEKFKFVSGDAIGTRSNPVIIEPNEKYQSIALQSGWNWISFNVAASSSSLNQMLNNYHAEPGDIIKGQFGFSEYTAENGWIGTLDVLRPEAGYRLRSHVAGELLTVGRPASTWATPASLSPGWNWIGYLPEKSLSVKDALYFVQSVPGDMIKGQYQSAVYNNNGEWLGTLREMHPGQGYLLYNQSNTDLIYPDLKKPVNKEISYPEKTDWAFDAYEYETNMTAITAFEFKGTWFGDSTSIVAAFINGQCRGLARPEYVKFLDRYVTFLMIYGAVAEKGDSVLVKIYDPAQKLTRAVKTALMFSTDNHIGNLQQPVKMEVLETDNERIPREFYLRQNYPNPFNPSTKIEYGLPVDEKVTLIIYNLLGQKVAVLVDGRQKAGRYEILFNATKANLASGIYFYRVRTDSYSKTHKMLLLK